MMSSRKFLENITLPEKKENLYKLLKNIDNIWDKYIIYSRVKAYRNGETAREHIKKYFTDQCSLKEQSEILPAHACLFYFKHGKEFDLKINDHVLRGLDDMPSEKLKTELNWQDEVSNLIKYKEEDQILLINKIYRELVDNK